MDFKQALITFLFVITTLSTTTSGQQKPICSPIQGSPNDRETHFLFFVDRTLDEPLLTRLVYLLRAISCEIPVSEKIKSMVVSMTGSEVKFGDSVTSDQLPQFLNAESLGGGSKEYCKLFQRALWLLPPSFLNQKNVQFVVPIFDDVPGCSMLETFQNHFQDDSRKDNFFFNGILINSIVTENNNQSIRVVIPDLTKAIDPERDMLNGSENITDVHGSAPLVQSYAEMIHEILKGNIVHDWERNETTTMRTTTVDTTTTSSYRAQKKIRNLQNLPASTPSSALTTRNVSTTRNASTTTMQVLRFAQDFDDVAKLFAAEDEDTPTSTPPTTSGLLNNTTTNLPSQNTTTGTLTTTEDLNSTATTRNSTATSESTTESPTNMWIVVSRISNHETTTHLSGNTTTESSNIIVKAAPPLPLLGGVNASTTEFNTTTDGLAELDPEIMMLILILILIFVLIAVLLCFIWMFYCARNKKETIDNDLEAQGKPVQEERKPLIKKNPPLPLPAPVSPACSDKGKEGEDEDPDDKEWNDIKPATYSGETKSDAESARPSAPAARYNPVEVSELEANNDDEVNDRPRHGYLPTRKTADLQFD
uniref:Uncharacterized protein n=1 Tax=Caenorhabditis japonica TaxID=281687 RepID=A0A8R1DS56_CAEJA